MVKKCQTAAVTATKWRTYRPNARPAFRKADRCLLRRGLRGRRDGPDDLSQALSALGRALRAHQQIIRLAPAFFDAAVVDRVAENNAELRRWLATWEPAFIAAYGSKPDFSAFHDQVPSLPAPRIQRKVERKLAEREMCLEAAHLAFERHRQRRPHALMSWCRMARLLELGFGFANLATGMESPNCVPDKWVFDYELTDLKRSLGLLPERSARPASAPGSAPAKPG